MPVIADRRGPVVVVTIDRAERHNLLDPATMRSLGQALGEAAEDDATRAVVLTAAGGESFCAGLDLAALTDGPAQLTTDGSTGLGILLDEVYPKPIVAAVNGRALGAGFELVLGCDLVVAADHAVFGLPEVRHGLVAAGGGITRLARRLPLAVALELGLTGEPVDCTRAVALGLVNRVTTPADTLPTALDLAERIAANAPLAVDFTKRHMHSTAACSACADATSDEFATGFETILRSEDAREGALAFADRRPPRFRGR